MWSAAPPTTLCCPSRASSHLATHLTPSWSHRPCCQLQTLIAADTSFSTRAELASFSTRAESSSSTTRTKLGSRDLLLAARIIDCAESTLSAQIIRTPVHAGFGSLRRACQGARGPVSSALLAVGAVVILCWFAASRTTALQGERSAEAGNSEPKFRAGPRGNLAEVDTREGRVLP